MTNYFCAWLDVDSSHTIIKQGQDAVAAWLRECLTDNGLGCPVMIANQLETLDADSGHGGTPIKVAFFGGPCTFTITEITDLGDAA